MRIWGAAIGKSFREKNMFNIAGASPELLAALQSTQKSIFKIEEDISVLKTELAAVRGDVSSMMSMITGFCDKFDVFIKSQSQYSPMRKQRNSSPRSPVTGSDDNALGTLFSDHLFI